MEQQEAIHLMVHHFVKEKSPLINHLHGLSVPLFYVSVALSFSRRSALPRSCITLNLGDIILFHQHWLSFCPAIFFMQLLLNSVGYIAARNEMGSHFSHCQDNSNSLKIILLLSYLVITSTDLIWLL